MLLNTVPAVASMAVVVVGAEVDSAEPKLEMLTGLVCMFSTVTWSGIIMGLAGFVTDSFICAVSDGTSFGRLMLFWVGASC